MNKRKVKVLFVCMGNICRSPTAHGVFQNLVNDNNMANNFEIDSAGTHAYHVGEKPDKRAMSTASGKGVDLSYIRARQVEVSDFSYYDYILAMDQDNYSNLMRIAPDEYHSKVHLFLDFAEKNKTFKEVPDPYYGGIKGFDNVFDMVDDASHGLLNHIRLNKL
ncbi:MAG: low molecular weight phosphotyrosine protein phosphatase [Gammaproteobacteria bacterium]|nr:low molecular weight phosphotyrosine protein phosphatase [Gammaproteobacteria bacterium]